MFHIIWNLIYYVNNKFEMLFYVLLPEVDHKGFIG
jgi:hypothetical protein